MYLKKLEMLGFKSFADRTELLFQQGMTGIVGPNGCGKSNVVDAFKWIFGEQSAKGLRGSEMRDVIFNGTQERKPTGFAEVSIVFENSDRFLDIDYSEVSITRRLFRSGESEYLINKQKARLKDIRELIMGTGLGQSSYSILEQGKLDVLLQSSNVDRRIIFEEAAGISKYLARKAEALRALLRVEENLTRLNDIIDEVEKRLHRVKAQASKARRHKDLSDRLRELRVRSTIEEYRESRDARAEISFRLHWHELQQRHLEALIGEVARACDEKSEQREAHARVLRDLNEELAADRVLLERAKERKSQGEERLRELEAEGGRKSEDLQATLGLLRELSERLEGERQGLEAKRLEIVGLREDCERVGRRLDEVRSRREGIESSLREKKDGVVSLMQDRSRVSNAVVAMEAEMGNLVARADRLRASLDGFGQSLLTAESRKSEEEEELRRLAAEGARLEELLARVASEESTLVARAEALEGEVSENRSRLDQCGSRLEVLRTLERNLEGLGRGVADILRRKESPPADAPPGDVPPAESPPAESPYGHLPSALAQVHGIVASFVKVGTEHARAVEAALGHHAQSLLVETQEGALGLLDLARAESLGALEVVSLDRVDAIDVGRFPVRAGVLGALRERIDVPEELSDFFDRMLAGVVLVEDFDTAVALSRNGLRPFRLVTLAGELLEPWGGLSIAGENELGLISRRSEMDHLEVQLRRLQDEERDVRERQSGVKRELSARREEIERLREERARIDRARVQAQGGVEQHSRDVDRLSREISLGSGELEEIGAQIADREDEKLSLARRLAAVEGDIAEAEDRIRGLEADLETAKGEESVEGDAFTQARLALAQAEKGEEGLRELLARQEANLRERQVHLEGLREEIDAVGRRTKEVLDSIADSETEISRIGGLQERTAEQIEAADEVDGKLLGGEQTYRRALESLHQAHSQVQAERQSAQLRDQEERHRRNALVERLDEEYRVDLPALMELEDVVLASADLDPDLPEEARYLLPSASWSRERSREEIREIQEKIRRLGAVNLEALDELTELEERNRFQLAQRSDLLESEKNLRGIIGEINRTSREMFLKTFEEVQNHFSELFRKCFGGGKAELVLEEGADVLEAGIDIVARPPGKKITRLSLMSGGEKTMTTIALLFAIFRSRPSPFCILDEVDAPLDETNVRRFVVLLKDFLASTQFIVITHNKLTMAEANTLYGITMQDRGVSTRVSVELATYDPETMQTAGAR